MTRTRAFVAAEMSRASRNTFETVITETPALSAMCLRVTIRVCPLFARWQGTQATEETKRDADGSFQRVFLESDYTWAPIQPSFARRVLKKLLPARWSKRTSCRLRRICTSLPNLRGM